MVWPFLILLGYTNKPSRNLVALMAAGMAGLTCGEHLAHISKSYGSSARAWEFGIGGLASLLPSTRLAINGRIVRLLGWLGLAALAGACIGLPSETGFPGGALLIPVDRICGPERCEVVQDGRIIFRDGDHLTASYVESLAPALGARLVPLISMNGPDAGR